MTYAFIGPYISDVRKINKLLLIFKGDTRLGTDEARNERRNE